MKLFGIKIFEPVKENSETIQTLPPEVGMDGAIDLTELMSGFSSYGVTFDDDKVEDENILISRYREAAQNAEISKAINIIINQAFSYDEDAYPVRLNLDNLNCSDEVKDAILNEFQNVMEMLNFKDDSFLIFRRWYIDGKMYYHKVVDTAHLDEGILELNWIDPRKIRKVREQIKNGKPSNLPPDIKVEGDLVEYFVYNQDGIETKAPSGQAISPDSISFIHSGIFDKSNKVILSEIHQAMKPLNQLKLIEDSLIIYRLSRAPERRIFNIEVGKLPKQKAEQYVADTMARYKKKLQYDPLTGEVRDSKRIMSMMEDFWFPKRDGKGTTVDTAQGGMNLGEIKDVDYFKQKLHEALNVPSSRFNPETGFNLGKSSEITRDELEFMKFVHRLRKRFAGLFDDILKTQLILKNIIKPEEWHELENHIYYDFLEDNHFTEFKTTEIWQNRFAAAKDAKDLVSDGYISKDFVRKTLLYIDDEEWAEMQSEIEKDKKEALEKQKQEAELQQLNGPTDEQDENGQNIPNNNQLEQPENYEEEPAEEEEEETQQTESRQKDFNRLLLERIKNL